eukprot:Seg1823.11 transcript_id=Seg1823.11/GoldUCD/mRNA.D3Y31 product="Tetratricopeptide repeat protein 36" protein_id=Seg1823.11/GoldUCD/D3Y31
MAARSKDDLVLEAIFNPNLPNVTEEEICKECSCDDELDPAILSKVKELEIEGVNAAEAGDMEKSLQVLNNAINLAPNYASSYNNRAQLYRIQGDMEAAKQDLETAISLSNGQGKAAAQAYTQRALLKKVDGDNEGAYHDFKRAACLGNSFAKSQAVQMNPYAALCNQMLSQAVDKLKRGVVDD